MSVQVFPSRVELLLSAPVEFRRAYLHGDADARLPDRYYVNLFPAILDRQSPSVFNVADGPMQRVRISQFQTGMVRVVLDLRGAHEGQVTLLSDPLRLVIDVDGTGGEATPSSQKQPQVFTEEASAVEPSASENPLVQKKKQALRERPSSLTWRIETRPWSMMPSPQAVQALRAVESLLTGSHAGLQASTPHVPVAPQLLLMEPRREARVAAPDFAPFLTLQPVASSQPDLLASAVDGIPFSSHWSWERACQEIGCILVGGEGFPGAPRNDEQIAIQGSEEADVAQDLSPPTPELNFAGSSHAGGVIMHEFWLAMVSIGALLSFLAGVGVMMLWHRRRAGARMEKRDGWETRMAYLEEAVNRAGVLNSSFFHSLEVTQKRLETLLSQADLTEQNLRRLIHQAVITGDTPARRGEAAVASAGRSDSLTTAALLLSEGEDARQVARTLKLPLAQVRLLQEIRQLSQATEPEKVTEPREKVTAPREKTAARQAPEEKITLLQDVLVRLNGVERNGTRFAQNGQSL
jgi:hypothetical protein